jgi:hypothetical protein
MKADYSCLAIIIVNPFKWNFMKLVSAFLRLMPAVISMTVFLSCNKLPMDVDLRDAKNVLEICRVKQIIVGDAFNNDSRTFQYNAANDPVSVKIVQPGTGHPNLFFKYDRKGNLVEYAGLYTVDYNNATFEFLHRYGYSKNRIVMDTMWVFGEYANPEASYSKRYVYITYDDFNRVALDSEVYVKPFPYINLINHGYDANGNRIASYSYDDKLSVHRTNKVWMFIDRNYSLNNMEGATSYNVLGLPLTFPETPKFSYSFANQSYFSSIQIVYDCK